MAQDHRIQWVYSSKTNEELEERYDQWAGEYDADLNDRLGWIGPRPAAEESARRGRRYGTRGDGAKGARLHPGIIRPSNQQVHTGAQRRQGYR